jgi:16S rRNA (cytosine967-C5)-methyltransferase
LQASILASAARLVKAGGRLVYATCSLLPEENERQIEIFLAAHADFKLLPVSAIAKAWLGADYTHPYLSLTPAQHNTDGFFAAVMERSGVKESL